MSTNFAMALKASLSQEALGAPISSSDVDKIWAALPGSRRSIRGGQRLVLTAAKALVRLEDYVVKLRAANTLKVRVRAGSAADEVAFVRGWFRDNDLESTYPDIVQKMDEEMTKGTDPKVVLRVVADWFHEKGLEEDYYEIVNTIGDALKASRLLVEAEIFNEAVREIAKILNKLRTIVKRRGFQENLGQRELRQFHDDCLAGKFGKMDNNECYKYEAILSNGIDNLYDTTYDSTFRAWLKAAKEDADPTAGIKAIPPIKEDQADPRLKNKQKEDDHYNELLKDKKRPAVIVNNLEGTEGKLYEAAEVTFEELRKKGPEWTLAVWCDTITEARKMARILEDGREDKTIQPSTWPATKSPQALDDAEIGKLESPEEKVARLRRSNVTAAILKAEWRDWRQANGVEVVTNRGQQVETFGSLEEAKKKYPTLDPTTNTNDFTWAMRGTDNRMRFEDWRTNDALSASKVRFSSKLNLSAFPKKKRDPLDAQIEQAWYKHGHGVQIPIMDIPKVFSLARQKAAEGGNVEEAVKELADYYRADTEKRFADEHARRSNPEGGPKKDLDVQIAGASRWGKDKNGKTIRIGSKVRVTETTPDGRPLFELTGVVDKIHDDGETMINYDLVTPGGRGYGWHYRDDITLVAAKIFASADDNVVDAYVEAALWASGADDEHESLEEFNPSDEFKAQAKEDVDAFLKKVEEAGIKLDLGAQTGGGWTLGAQLGHDLWLTRNGHGTGFWDRGDLYGSEEIGKKLTDLAHEMGEVQPYLGDDQLVYATLLSEVSVPVAREVQGSQEVRVEPTRLSRFKAAAKAFPKGSFEIEIPFSELAGDLGLDYKEPYEMVEDTEYYWLKDDEAKQLAERLGVEGELTEDVLDNVRQAYTDACRWADERYVQKAQENAVEQAMETFSDYPYEYLGYADFDNGTEESFSGKARGLEGIKIENDKVWLKVNADFGHIINDLLAGYGTFEPIADPSHADAPFTVENIKSHLHWLKQYADIYGADSDASSIYEREMKHYNGANPKDDDIREALEGLGVKVRPGKKSSAPEIAKVNA